MEKNNYQEIIKEWEKTIIPFNGLTVQDIEADIEELVEITNDEVEATKIYILAIKKARVSKWKTSMGVSKQCQTWLSQGFKTYQEVWDFEKEQSKKSNTSKLPLKESVPDWENQEVIEMSKKKQNDLDDLMLWFADRNKYFLTDPYKKVAKFDDWKEFNKKRAISCN